MRSEAIGIAPPSGVVNLRNSLLSSLDSEV